MRERELGCGEDGVERENVGRHGQNWGALEEWCGNGEQWKFPGIYDGNLRRILSNRCRVSLTTSYKIRLLVQKWVVVY